MRHREKIARQKTRRFRHWSYWGRPVPGFGDPDARLVVVGLAPAAHGANRTGRIFTGDRSGDWLYGALHRAGFANQPDSISRSDGLRLRGCYVTAAVRCAPPENRPTPAERDRCFEYLVREFEILRDPRVVIALGGFAFRSVLALWRALGGTMPRPAPRFAHCARLRLTEGARRPLFLIASYHPSQQNTFTGKLTREAFDRVFAVARQALG